MSLFSKTDRDFVRAVSDLAFCNPFLPERIKAERRALGPAFVHRPNVISKCDDFGDMHPNIMRTMERVRELLARIQPAVRKQMETLLRNPQDEDFQLYENMVLFLLFHEHLRDMDVLAEQGAARRVTFYAAFAETYQNAFSGGAEPAVIAQIFALLFQLRRAFRNIYDFIIGESMPAAQLRAEVWQSIFTHDIRRYRRILFDRMVDMTCLITGPSGTGKELVAKAIALSRFVPFDPHTLTFTEEFNKSFFPLNLSALSPTLIESELFGHRRGSFTGALADRVGWLEVCPPRAAVFLDEIGELEGSLQVKLLRVLQTRTFQRIGESQERIFRGKIIAATNRDLACEMREHRFREDLYYRLCSDVIVTPSLRDQLSDSPEALLTLVTHIAIRLTSEEEAPALAAEVVAWIAANLGSNYPWPGNVRELEQCVRNILIRKSYRVPAMEPVPGSGGSCEALSAAVARGALNAEELLEHYTALIYAQSGSYQETARRLGVDHRTVKSRLRAELIERYRS